MIQRKQTLWLLLSTVSGILSFRFPFATGKAMVKEVLTDSKLTAANDFFILIVTVALVALSAIIIFLYKDRSLQMKLALGGAALGILNLVLYYLGWQHLTDATLALSCLFPPAILAGFILAFVGIRKDEKLVKSLDKLR